MFIIYTTFKFDEKLKNLNKNNFELVITDTMKKSIGVIIIKILEQFIIKVMTIFQCHILN